MPTPEETLAAFEAGYAPPANLPDPMRAALDTLRAVGAIPAEGTPDPVTTPDTFANVARAVAPTGNALGGAVANTTEAIAPRQPMDPYADPAVPGAAPADPYALPKAPATPEEGDAQVQQGLTDIGTAQQDAADKKLAADTARAEKQAQTAERYATATAAAQNDYMTQHAAANAQADAETAAWLSELEAQSRKEPNPGRYWENQSGLGQALWAMGLIAGAVNVAITPGAKNAALQMLDAEIDKDVALQQKRMERELSALRQKGTSMEARHARNASDRTNEYTMKLTRLQALERAWMARDVVPGDLDAQAAKAQSQATFAELKLPYIDKARNQRYAEKAAAIDRNFQAGQQKLRLAHQAALQEDEQAHAKEMEDKKFGHQLALSPVSASVGGNQYNPVGKDGIPVLFELSSRTDAQGAPQVQLATGDDKTARDGVVRFRSEKQFEKANLTIKTADELYNTLTRIRDKLDGVGPGVALTGITDPELNADIQAAGYAIAQLENDRVTDKDFSSGVAQSIGFDPNGRWLDRGKFALSKDDVVKQISKMIETHHKKVEAGLQQFNDAAINGQGTKILYKPADLQPDAKPPEQTSFDVRGAPPIRTAVEGGRRAEPVKSADDYRTRTRLAKDDPERASLPVHDAALVNKVLNESAKAGPSTVRASVDKALAALKERKDAIESRVDAELTRAGDPWASGERAVDQRSMEAATKELEKIQETEAILKPLAKDLEKKATSTLAKFKDHVKFVRGTQWGQRVSEDAMRRKATEMGLGAAPDDVERIIREVNAIKTGSPLE